MKLIIEANYHYKMYNNQWVKPILKMQYSSKEDLERDLLPALKILRRASATKTYYRNASDNVVRLLLSTKAHQLTNEAIEKYTIELEYLEEMYKEWQTKEKDKSYLEYDGVQFHINNFISPAYEILNYTIMTLDEWFDKP